MTSKKNKGFTLVELIASLAIFTILSVTIVSLITLSIKHNSINKQRYESDLNSKTFIELMNSSSNRPEKPLPTPLPIPTPSFFSRNGNYFFKFDTENELIDFVNNVFVKTESESMMSYLLASDPEANILDAMEEVKLYSSSKRFGIIIASKWDNGSGIYDIDLWSWDINKGKPSLVNRKVLLRSRT